MKRVLITGASGFIGRHCLQPLLDYGYEVHAVARQRLPASDSITWHLVDLLEGGAASALACRVQATHLLHLAWCASPFDYLTNPVNRQWVSITLELAGAFIAAGGNRFVGAGSCAEYAPSPTRCIEDATPLRPASLYGESKVAACRGLAALAQTARLHFAWGRVFFPYGPYQACARLIPSVITALLQRDPIHCPPGDQLRDFIYVQDAARALVVLLDSELTGACNIASGSPVTVRDLISFIARLTGGKELLSFDAPAQRAAKPASIVADTNRLCRELGWHPRLPLEDGLKQTIDWWRANLCN